MKVRRPVSPGAPLDSASLAYDRLGPGDRFADGGPESVPSAPVTTYTAFFPFCGLGAGARGFLDASEHLNGAAYRFRSLGGVDIDRDACADFERLTGTRALCADWSALTVAELLAYAGADAPDIVFMSPPCKGFSGLLGAEKASTAKYQALNRLVILSVKLMLEAWGARPPRLVLLENVPRIATRGKALLAEVKRLLRVHGYAFHGGTHDCGEIGGLAQHRKRFLLVARHTASTSQWLYHPTAKRVRGVGEVLETLPLPNDPAAGPMHVLPGISTLNWRRLALIPPGGDWRDLPSPEDVGGADTHTNLYRVFAFDRPTTTVIGATRPGSGAFSVADIRVPRAYAGVYGIVPWGGPASTVTGQASPSTGAYSVADLRLTGAGRGAYHHVLALAGWGDPSGTVTGARSPLSGAASTSDPRVPAWHHGVLGVTDWTEPHGVVAGASAVGNGRFAIVDVRVKATPYPHTYGVLSWTRPAHTIAGMSSSPGTGPYSVADVRIGCAMRDTCGAYGVLPWEQPAWTVTGSLQVDTGWACVADPRVPGSPSLAVRWFPRDLKSPPPFALVLPTADGSWHRPLTTLELAALQGLPRTWDDGTPLVLAGRSSSGWRERIGNAVPVQAAAAIAAQMLRTLALSDAGRFALSTAGAVWVEPVHSIEEFALSH